MINDIQGLLDEYVHWLKDKTTFRQLDKWIEITTPYLDRHNDYLQLYAKKDDGKITITDDGYIIQDLIQNGCKLDTKKRRELLQMTLNGFGIQLTDDNALLTHATVQNFALQKHNLIQAMLAVNDLFYLSAPIVENLFLEDVMEWLELHNIRYIQNAKFTGESGYDHLFDFAIPKSRQQPERLLRAISRPVRDTSESFILAWVDTKKVRASDSKAYAFLNDAERTVSNSIAETLKSYNIQPVIWSLRDRYVEELAA